MIYFKSSNLSYSELEFWTNFCPFYRLDLYGEWPMVKITHTQVLGNSLKNTSRSRATYSWLHETSCCSILNMLELPGFLPETAVTCISYFLPICVPWRRSLLPVSMTSAPWEVPQEKAALGQALQGHPAQQRDLPPSLPQTAMNTRLMPHPHPWPRDAGGKAGRRALARRVPYCTSCWRCSHHSPQHAMGKRSWSLISRAVDFFGRKALKLLQTVKSCSSKGKISKPASKNFVSSSEAAPKQYYFKLPLC